MTTSRDATHVVSPMHVQDGAVINRVARQDESRSVGVLPPPRPPAGISSRATREHVLTRLCQEACFIG